MLVLVMIVPVALFFPLLLSALAYIIGSRARAGRDIRTPYECGFDPIGRARAPFSIRFFLVAIIFVLFDVEMVLLLSIPAVPYLAAFGNPVLAAGIFLSALFWGLLHEWREGALDWT